MSDYIFTIGSCQKNQVYDTIKNAMIAAGWQNISSSATTDFDVMNSPGEDGARNLVIQMRPTGTANTNSIVTTDYCVASYRLIDSYIPKAGAAGTVGRTAETWKALYIVPSTGTVSGTTMIDYKIHANKNRVIVVLQTPTALNLGAITIYIGLPDKTYCSEPLSRGLLVATSAYALAANVVNITNSTGEMPVQTASDTRVVYCTLAPKNPNSSGNYMLSEMFYGNATEGMRGKLTGLYVLPNVNLVSGDIIQIGTKSFYVVVNAVASYSSYPSAALAVQIS